jgi:hypothetical protein
VGLRACLDMMVLAGNHTLAIQHTVKHMLTEPTWLIVITDLCKVDHKNINITTPDDNTVMYLGTLPYQD